MGSDVPRINALIEHRDALEEGLRRAAARDAEARWRLWGRFEGRGRRALAVAAAAAVLIPAGFAAARLVSGSFASHPVSPAPRPLLGSQGQFPECPWTMDKLVELETIDAYADTPGYPLPTCPTLDELKRHPGIVATFERIKREAGDTP
jgi:hypothetical protein